MSDALPEDQEKMRFFSVKMDYFGISIAQLRQRDDGGKLSEFRKMTMVLFYSNILRRSLPKLY